MVPLGWHDQQIAGELLLRAERNFARLEEPDYREEGFFRSAASGTNAGWPGDHEGRTILGLTLLARALDREPAFLADHLARLPRLANERGYLGEVLPQGQADEQQLSGHSWLLRGLCEHHLRTGEQAPLEWAARIARALFLPTRDAYAAYEAGDRTAVDGAPAGSLLTGAQGLWRSSTDVGCAFIPLDGVTQVYELAPSEELRALIETMLERYLAMDFVGGALQTHATLSGLRGLLRYQGLTGDSGLLAEARRVFALYLREGLTENYANHNWFTRPQWTEPCAVIDSFMVATQLWQRTGEADYLETAHHIYANAMGYGQRPNGGWGCDLCLGAADPFLTPLEGAFEAWWCCTMRGAEGLARAAENAWQLADDGATLAFAFGGAARLAFAEGEVLLRQETGLPREGWVRLMVLRSDLSVPKRLRVFLPPGGDEGSLAVTLDGAAARWGHEGRFVVTELPRHAGQTLELRFDLLLRQAERLTERALVGYRTLRHGPLILGLRGAGREIAMPDPDRLAPLGNGRYALPDGGLLEPLDDMIHLPAEEARRDRRQAMFRG